MISIILPFHNEKENLPLLLKDIEEIQKSKIISDSIEVVLVDDGSTDSWKDNLVYPSSISVITASFAKRRGKGNALALGVEKSHGEIIVFMDADLQDNPHDLPLFLDKIKSGAMLVNGVREQRHDSHLIRYYSRIFNGILRLFFSSPFHDINCGFKVMRRQLFQSFQLYGNNFRLLPLATYLKGFSVAEVSIHNQKRIYGHSKFGPGKAFVGFIDLVTAYFLFRFSEQPFHFFGTIGGILCGIGLIINSVLVFERIAYGELLYRRPMLWFGILFIIVGIQIGMTGIIGELIVHYFKGSSGSVRERKHTS